MKLKGYFLAALAAATYGTNPVFAVPLYGEGMNPVSVLLFRYMLSLPFLALMIFYRGQSWTLKRNEIWPVAMLGLLMAMSSLTLFMAYEYMNAGVASTLLFVYPVMVAVLMSFFFHERFRFTTGLCLLVMAAGLMLLLKTDGDTPLSLTGFLLVLISSLTYAIYLVMTNVSGTVAAIPTLKLLFYQILIGSSLFVAVLAGGVTLTLPAVPVAWLNLVALALLPTAISLMCTTTAIHCIGSTPTAIFGALEPVTAVVLSIIFLGQGLTTNEIIGGTLIVIATTMVVAADPIDKALLRMRKMFPSRRKV